MKTHLSAKLLIALAFIVASCAPNTTGPTSTAVSPTLGLNSPSTPIATATFIPEPSPTPKYGIKKFDSHSPVSQLTDQEVSQLGIKCSGSPEQIVNCILDWQKTHILYCGGVEGKMPYPQCSDSIRWNYFLPGILPTHDLLVNGARNVKGKMMGVCFDYAITFCSFAQYYGLECRIVSSIIKPSDRNPKLKDFSTGMSPEEYTRLSQVLSQNGLNYPYDAVSKVAGETPEHYWAEVKIGDKWTIADATGTNVQSMYISKKDYILVDWAAQDKSQTLVDDAIQIIKCTPDMAIAANTLNIPVEQLQSALGDLTQGPPDFTTAARKLGIGENALRTAIYQAYAMLPPTCQTQNSGGPNSGQPNGSQPNVQGQGDAACYPNFPQAAATLNITVMQLQSAFVGQTPSQPDFAAAARKLGISEDALRQAIYQTVPPSCLSQNGGK